MLTQVPHAATAAGPNLESLDALRGALALYVMFGHARWLLWDGHWQWIQSAHPWWADLLAYASGTLRYGHEAVLCFFVLSGFFIHFRWAAARAAGAEPRFEVGAYARRRAHRLLPPYAAALAATLVLDLAGRAWFPALYASQSGVASLDDAFAQMRYSADSVVPALLMLPGAAGVHFGTNGPLWSLAYEFIYYALYPLLLVARARYGPWTYVAVAGSCILLSAVVPLGFAGEALQLYSLWLAGAVLVEAMVSRRLRPSPALGLGCFVAGLAGIHGVKGVLAVVPYLLLGFGAVAFAATVPPRWGRWRIHRALHWVGLRSYTLYICHFSFLALLGAATIETLGRRPSSGWLALAGAAAALAWCCLLWWLVERRFMHERLAAPPAWPAQA